MKRVISASRRVDMVAGFADQLLDLLREKWPPNDTHTLVLWTKNPENLFAHQALRDWCRQYPLYVHFTITGMGGSVLEPAVPPMSEALKLLGPLVEYVGNPQRVRIRFDPIVHLRLPGGEEICNLGKFGEIAKEARSHAITCFSISWMAAYRKVISRLSKHGIFEIPIRQARWREELDWLSETAAGHSITLHGCCVSGMPVSRCIDGELLTLLHPEGIPCSTRKAKGQRATCGCTESVDIGWYNPCPHGCLYCYANPAPTSECVHGH